MEEQYFNLLRDQLILSDKHILSGKMMRSEAITYKDKVFAFFSRKKKMVFKLGKDFDPDRIGTEVQVFNPFTKRPPLHGWFEVPFSEKNLWRPLSIQALNTLKQEL